MIWWRVGSRPATAARTETGLPAPTSPVMTPRADSATQKLTRATASAWALRGKRSAAAIALPNGVLFRPKWATQGAGLIVPLRRCLPLRRLVPRRRPVGRSRPCSPSRSPHRGRPPPSRGSRSRSPRALVVCLGDAAVRVASDDERDGHTGRAAFKEHIDVREVLGVVAELHAPSDQGGVDAVMVPLQGDRGGFGDLAGAGPAEGLDQDGRLGRTVGPGPLETGDRGLFGLGVHPLVGDLFGPGTEQVVQFVEGADAPVGGLGEEALADVAVEALLFAPALGRIGL